jgi:hypothetical protein
MGNEASNESNDTATTVTASSSSHGGRDRGCAMWSSSCSGDGDRVKDMKPQHGRAPSSSSYEVDDQQHDVLTAPTPQHHQRSLQQQQQRKKAAPNDEHTGKGHHRRNSSAAVGPNGRLEAWSPISGTGKSSYHPNAQTNPDFFSPRQTPSTSSSHNHLGSGKPTIASTTVQPGTSTNSDGTPMPSVMRVNTSGGAPIRTSSQEPRMIVTDVTDTTYGNDTEHEEVQLPLLADDSSLIIGEEPIIPPRPKNVPPLNLTRVRVY